MAEARAASLLDFAIAASVAVLPFMLCILLLVAALRPAADTARWQDDRYVSVRHVAALKTFEHAVVRRPTSAPIAAPKAAEVLAGIPQCRGDWAEAWSAAAWLRELRGRAVQAEPTPAQRIATQLAELDRALLHFSSRPNTRVDAPVGVDADRWFDAASKVLGASIETPESPGMRFQVRCADLSAALASLLRSDGRMLEALAWRGTEVGTVVARWHADQFVEISAAQVARRNPWNGVSGCIYLGQQGESAQAAPAYFVASARSADARVCALPAMAGTSTAAQAKRPAPVRAEPGPGVTVDDARWMVPPSLHTMLQPLETLRRPTGALYRLYTDADPAPARLPTGYRYGPNRITLDGATVDVGFSIDLTIDPALQALAQKTAACYTGRQDACQALGMRRAEDNGRPIGHQLLESAMVRMAAVAVIDVASGRIEALAGALSPCARQAFDGPGLGADCDKRLPYPVQYRPDALLNPAVFHDAMPASTIKPIMAAAFLADNGVGARWLSAEQAAMKKPTAPTPDSLRGQLMRSDSARFLDRMFCADKSFADCRRAWNVQSAALAFGWNTGCTEARVDCGKHDLLFGRAIDATAESGWIQPLTTSVAYGRLLSEPVGGKLGAPLQLTPQAVLHPAIVRRCATGADGQRPSKDDWEKCRGGSVVDVVAEGWGQGHARSSALGVAGMMAALAAAANGQPELRRPHLVRALRGAGSPDAAQLESAVVRWSLAQPQPNRISPEAAQVILNALSYSHRAGTARGACEQVFDARSCRGIDWIAGKTGTPSFPNDDRSLDDLARLCTRGDDKPRQNDPACGPLRPYKWFVAAYRTDPRGGGPWTKVMGVLTERNWLARSGRIHGASDHGPNPSAEIAMQITGRQLGLLSADTP